MEFFDWLNSLCPRMQHILQVEFSKEFYYDLGLAHEATKNSLLMLERERLGHFHSINLPSLAEVVSCATINNNDEKALQSMLQEWRLFPLDYLALRYYPLIGIGITYKPDTDQLYASIRLSNRA